MTDEELKAIEQRAAKAAYDEDAPKDQILSTDVPALIAEVKRLRGEVEKLEEQIVDIEERIADERDS